MQHNFLSHAALALLISAYPIGPTIAEALPANSAAQPVQANPAPEPPPVLLNRVITIPESSVIAATFCSAVKFENERESGFPVTLFLARPIMDGDGGTIAPVNSLVNAQVKPTSEGVKIQVDALVVGGRMIPVKTAALSIPILATAKQEDRYDKYAYAGDGSTYYAQPGRGVALGVVSGLQSWLPNQEFLPSTASGLLGAGLAIAAGVVAAKEKPKKAKLIEVPQGGTLIFPLLSPITLSPEIMRVASSLTAQTAMSLCSTYVGAAQDPSDEAADEDEQNSFDETSNSSNDSSGRNSNNDYDD